MEDCFFPDYHYVERFDGYGTCEPRYPLIYEVAYRHDLDWLVPAILFQDPELELNGRDASKMTALHYAVLRSIEVVKLLLAQGSINANITNGDGLTPAQLARQLGQRHIAALIEAHHTAKMVPLSVTPREKLTTLWGRLKQRN